MSLENILTEICADKADAAELEHVLLSYFHQCSHSSNDSLLYGDPENAALELKYSKSGRPTSLRPGPGFRPDDKVKLRRIVCDQLLTDGPIRVGRSVMFARIPTDGWFRSGDAFQLLPVPADAPRPQSSFGGHPLILEVAFPSSEDHDVSNLRLGKRRRQIELLCSLLLFPDLREQSISVTFHWVQEPLPDGSWTSTFRQGGYSWPGAQFETHAFSTVEGLPAIAQCDPQTYYAQRGFSAHQRLEVPTNFGESLQQVASLPDQKRERFFRASYWYAKSVCLWSISLSIAFAALVSCIEALMPEPPAGGSLRQAFVDFVDQFAPGVPERDRQHFYKLRSAISHGGKLLHTDEAVWGVGLRELTQDRDMRWLSWTVRSVLINWLHSPSSRTHDRGR